MPVPTGGNLCAVQFLLGHTKLMSAVRYFGIGWMTFYTSPIDKRHHSDGRARAMNGSDPIFKIMSISLSTEAGCSRTTTKVTSLFLFPVGIELLEKCKEVAGLLLVLQAGIDHLRARYLRFRILDVFAEGSLVPGDPGVLVRGRI